MATMACIKPFDQTREQHNNMMSMLILFGKRISLRVENKRFAPKWILFLCRSNLTDFAT
jgi:hypothetical protein